MGDLRDQLRKANLISKKDAKRLAHEERVHRTEVGGAKGVEQERAAREQELNALREQQREADREQQAERDAERLAAEERAACEAILAREVKRPGRRGASRWYFELPDGRLPWLELPQAERAQLEIGALCVVRTGAAGSHAYGLLAIEHGRRIAPLFPERIAWAARGALRAG